jgi:hypothetical protein
LLFFFPVYRETLKSNFLNPIKRLFMNKSVFTISVLFLLNSSISSQTIPTDSLYLGQTPPGALPAKFELSVNAGSFAAERIAVSNDGKEIYFTEVKNYYPATGDTIKYYRFSGCKWRGPFNLFPGYLSPSLSLTGDTMYFQTARSEYETFIAVKKDNGWTRPQRILKNLNSAHYLQVTGKGNYYISSKSDNTIGGNDWCKLISTDSVALSLGRPLNTEWDNLDFYIAKDESFLIVTTITGLAISYPKPDGGWTSPRNLGSRINFGLGSWGPYVTCDKKYLFYSTGTKPDYSDTGIFWVRIDNLTDSLKNTNNVPYLKKRLENKTGVVNSKVDFTIPADAFLDDDEETTFSYSAILNTGEPLPDWLTFDKMTGRFHGLPSEPVEYTVIVTAADKENAKGLGIFKLIIREK